MLITAAAAIPTISISVSVTYKCFYYAACTLPWPSQNPLASRIPYQVGKNVSIWWGGFMIDWCVTTHTANPNIQLQLQHRTYSIFQDNHTIFSCWIHIFLNCISLYLFTLESRTRFSGLTSRYAIFFPCIYLKVRTYYVAVVIVVVHMFVLLTKMLLPHLLNKIVHPFH